MASVRAPEAGRLGWIDAVRGACVLAVVLFHVTAWHVLTLDLAPVADRTWSVVNGYLGSLRMPLLLAVSGLLASRRILQGWRSPDSAERAASSYYLYVVWLAVYVAVYAVLGDPRLPHSIDGPGEAAAQLVWPQTPLWYVFALAVYVVVLTSLSRVAPWLVLTGLAVVSVLCQAAGWDPGLAAKVPELAFFFAVGVYGRTPLARFAERLDRRRTAVALIGAAATVAAGPVVPDGVPHAVLVLVRGVAFLLLGVAVVTLLIRWRPLGRAGSWIGRRTLPVYVLHAPLLLVMVAVAGREPTTALAGPLANPAVALAYPLVVTAVLVALTLLVHRLLLRLHCTALFAMPGSWVTAVRSTHARLTAAPATTGPEASRLPTGRRQPG
jgi:uncharacterized membrane protein YcfT